MSVTTDKPAGTTAIRPFHVEVPEEELADLRRRIAATRWPEPETVPDQSQGVQLSRLQGSEHGQPHKEPVRRRGRAPCAVHPAARDMRAARPGAAGWWS